MKNEEQKLALKISKYIQYQYPKVIFRFDLAADVRLTIGQAVRNKALQGGTRGYPDLFIALPMGNYCGLYIEIKTGIDKVFKKDGTYKKAEHLEEQVGMLGRLSELGYYACFGIGFDKTVRIIDNYMNSKTL